jgi:hypothetical protein
MITDEILSDPSDLRGMEQPYLRVYDTNEVEGEKIAFRLRLEGFDVEFIKLNKFLPKPLYSIGEIEAELRSLTAFRSDNYAEVSQALCFCENVKEKVCPYFLNAMSSLPSGLTDPQPSAEELSKPITVTSDPGAIPWRARYIRWHQMLAILGG